MNVKESFDFFAADYDASRRKLIPCFDSFYGALLEAVPFTAEQHFRCLDLGAGTGLVSAMLSKRFPSAHFVLVDLSHAMLQQARQRFGGDRRFEYAAMDYTAGDLRGPFELVVSALSIHHLEDQDKRRLFQRVAGIVSRGGAFLVADLIKGPTPGAERKYQEWWETAAFAAGATNEDWSAASQRRLHDIAAPLADQLQWLIEAGFHDVDCFFKKCNFAVFGGFQQAK